MAYMYIYIPYVVHRHRYVQYTYTSYALVVHTVSLLMDFHILCSCRVTVCTHVTKHAENISSIGTWCVERAC